MPTLASVKYTRPLTGMTNDCYWFENEIFFAAEETDETTLVEIFIPVC